MVYCTYATTRMIFKVVQEWGSQGRGKEERGLRRGKWKSGLVGEGQRGKRVKEGSSETFLNVPTLLDLVLVLI